MTSETIIKTTLSNQLWLEKAILSLDKSNAWTEEDKRLGVYLADFIRTRLKTVTLGSCLTTDVWVGRARALVKDYKNHLVAIALEKALENSKKYAKMSREAKQLALALKNELEPA